MEKQSLRYKTQMNLKNVGEEGQQKLSKASIAIVGVGGLGAPASLYLAASGIGKIALIDGDTVELSNLHRQIIFTEADVGKHKALMAKKRLTQSNSLVKIEAMAERIDSHNIEVLLEPYDIILDCTDNFYSRFLLNQYVVRCKKTLVYASVDQWSGQVALLYPGGPCLGCLFTDVQDGLFQDCRTAGVMGPTVGQVALLQVQKLIHYLLWGVKKDELILFDARHADIQKIEIQKNDKCLMCSEASSKKKSNDYMVSLKTYLSWKGEAELIDLRDKDFFDEGAISGAKHVPYMKIMSDDGLQQFEKTKKYVLYCHKNMTSPFIRSYLVSKGMESVYVLDRGYEGYCEVNA